MSAWKSYTEGRAKHTVVGELLKQEIYSPQLDNKREILVWLPQSYRKSEKHYPVIYMHDAQNLFDAYTSYVGEWRVDETMLGLEEEGIEAIIVGIPNNKDRVAEYSPYLSSNKKIPNGRGDVYLRFIVDTLKPLIDQDFGTLPARENTGIAGSSMGGLISLYGFLKHPTVFGFAGVFSPAYWFGKAAIFETVRESAFVDGKIYMDIGGREMVGAFEGVADFSHQYLLNVRKLSEVLRAKGYDDRRLYYVEDIEGKHNEDAWARRLPDALRFLLRSLT